MSTEEVTKKLTRANTTEREEAVRDRGGATMKGGREKTHATTGTATFFED